LNIVPKDRKISNVILENSQYRTIIDELKAENERLKDQIEQIMAMGTAGGQ
jgi:hypothetical protein